MKLRKVEWHELPLLNGLKAPVETRIVREVVEKPVDITEYLEPIRKEIDKLKRKRPEQTYVGGGQVGSYHRVTSTEIRFSSSSFHAGVNVIGVATGAPTTIYLPSRLDPNFIIVVKDELGVAATHPITVQVAT